MTIAFNTFRYIDKRDQLDLHWRTRGSERAGTARLRTPAVLGPERFSAPSLADGGRLAPSARAARALLSSVQRLARSFCLSVSGVVSPSAPGRGPISPARGLQGMSLARARQPIGPLAAALIVQRPRRLQKTPISAAPASSRRAPNAIGTSSGHIPLTICSKLAR